MVQVLIKELHASPLVSVWCWCGWARETNSRPDGRVSHWVEHMNFKGTVNIPRDEMKDRREFGGTWNGYT